MGGRVGSLLKLIRYRVVRLGRVKGQYLNARE